MPSSTVHAASASHYAHIARWYEPLLGRALAPLRQAVVDLCQRTHLATVLDACCGTGAQCALLHQASIACTGHDLSAPMLAVARTLVPARVTLLQGDAQVLPFAPASFDAVLFSLALHEMDPAVADAVLTEGLRVARHAIIADYRLAERNLDLPAAWFVHLPERLAGVTHYRNFKAFMQRGGVEGLVHRHRLRVLHRHRLFAGAGGLLLVTR